jgi:hypothetical protein
MSVVQLSADGNNDAGEWFDVPWFDRFVDGGFFVAALVYSALPGWLAMLILQHAGGEGALWTLPIASGALLFPVLQLSSLERGSPLLPFSVPILRTLRRSPLAWLAFYGLSIPLVSAACYLLHAAASGLQLVVTLPAVLYLGTVYFRLLGRLAWYCSEQAELEGAAEGLAEIGSQ